MKKLFFLLLIISIQVTAAPVRFDFVFDDPNSSARTEGFIVFEETLLSNPVDEIIILPSPKVLDLQLTVTGSVNSDGNYDINDYEVVDFWSNGGVLDFTQPLIGQATDGSPWGTTLDGNSGEFNLFPVGSVNGQSKFFSRNNYPQGIAGGPPGGCFWFTICENTGNGPQGVKVATKGIGGPGFSPMELQSMQPNRGTPAQSVPSLSFWSTLTLGVVFLVMAGLFRRRLI